MCNAGRAQAFRFGSWIMLIAVVLQFMEGCGMARQEQAGMLVPDSNSRAVPQPDASVLERDVLHSVAMQPQQPELPPFQMPMAAGEQRTLAQSALPHCATYLPLDLVRSGSAYISTGMPSNLVSAADQLALYSPCSSTAQPVLISELAYACYEFSVAGYAEAPTAGFLWSGSATPQVDGAYWVGLANWQRERWDWYAGPADSVLTLAGLSPYIEPATGRLLLLLLVPGNQQYALQRITLGAPEIRGSGALLESAGFVDLLPQFPEAGTGQTEADPAQVDLSGVCAPVRDQGQAQSGTAFAIADGAFNCELARLYSADGWDFAKSKNLCSPKYMYVETGAEQGLATPGAGRKTGACVDWLLRDGIATENSAPYLDLTNDEWSAEALADAQVLQIANYYRVNPAHAAGVQKVKVLLARFHIPVIVRINIDAAFCHYLPDSVWDYSGPTVSGQALLLVGYDDARQAFKARNSWSTAWGEGGYVWIGYETFVSHSAQAQPQGWIVFDDYNPATAQRFCSSQAGFASPTNVQASNGAYATKIVLSWEKNPEATQYVIYKDQPENNVAVVGDVSTWEDTNPGGTDCHAYWVQAAAGELASRLSTLDFGFVSQQVVVHSVAPTFGFTGQAMEFSADVTGAAPLTYTWDFGGGALPNTSSDATPAVTAGMPGMYSAYVKITNCYGSEKFTFGFIVNTPIFVMPDAADADWGPPITGSGTAADPYVFDGQNSDKEYSFCANTQADGDGNLIGTDTLQWEVFPPSSGTWTGSGTLRPTECSAGYIIAYNTAFYQHSYSIFFVTPPLP